LIKKCKSNRACLSEYQQLKCDHFLCAVEHFQCMSTPLNSKIVGISTRPPRGSLLNTAILAVSEEYVKRGMVICRRHYV
jgi:hypothetical protein